jgi:hypothetical protein
VLLLLLLLLPLPLQLQFMSRAVRQQVAIYTVYHW